MIRNRLYLLVIVACFIGTLYLLYQVNSATVQTPSVCLIKNATGYPCPSCGTTRAVVLLSKGKVAQSIQQNPFGLLVGLCMLVLPLWIGFDALKNKSTFHDFYLKTESVVRRPKVALLLVLLVILNWIWNLYKHI
ncbi:DUF2752 domain-containing protein [Flavobacterium sp.]